MSSYPEFEGETGAIQVVIGDLPGIWTQLLARLIDHQPDMAVKAIVQEETELLLEAKKGVDVVILGQAQTDEPPALCSHLLNEIPDLRVLVLAFGGDQLTTYWLGIRRRRLRVTSGRELIHYIRAAYKRDPMI